MLGGINKYYHILYVDWCYDGEKQGEASGSLGIAF